MRLLVLDVDGVLTDGRLYFTARGGRAECFHVRDGAGIKQVLQRGLQVAVISGRQPRRRRQAHERAGRRLVEQGVHDKLAALRRMCWKRASHHRQASVGDDTPDLSLLRSIAASRSRWRTRIRACTSRSPRHHARRRPGRGARGVRSIARGPRRSLDDLAHLIGLALLVVAGLTVFLGGRRGGTEPAETNARAAAAGLLHDRCGDR